MRLWMFRESLCSAQTADLPFLLQVYRAQSSPLSPTALQCVWGSRPASGAGCTAEPSLSDWSGNWPATSRCQVIITHTHIHTLRIKPEVMSSDFMMSLIRAIIFAIHPWSTPLLLHLMANLDLCFSQLAMTYQCFGVCVQYKIQCLFL